TLVLPSTGFGGGLEGCRWLICSTVLGGKKSGEVLAEDLVLGISLQALSTSIPTRDIPVEVEHVDCVVDNRPNQHLKAGSTARPWPFGRFPRISWQLPLRARRACVPAKQPKHSSSSRPRAVPSSGGPQLAVCALPPLEHTWIDPFSI